MDLDSKLISISWNQNFNRSCFYQIVKFSEGIHLRNFYCISFLWNLDDFDDEEIKKLLRIFYFLKIKCVFGETRDEIFDWVLRLFLNFFWRRMVTFSSRIINSIQKWTFIVSSFMYKFRNVPTFELPLPISSLQPFALECMKTVTGDTLIYLCLIRIFVSNFWIDRIFSKPIQKKEFITQRRYKKTRWKHANQNCITIIN